MRRENVSSVPALQRGLPPKRRHQDLPFRATRPAADPIFSHLPDGTFPRNAARKCLVSPRIAAWADSETPPPDFAVPRHSTSSRSNFFTPSRQRISQESAEFASDTVFAGDSTNSEI